MKRIIITGFFQKCTNGRFWAHSYCKEIAKSLIKLGVAVDIIDMSPIKEKISLGANCSHKYIGDSFFLPWNNPKWDKKNSKFIFKSPGIISYFKTIIGLICTIYNFNKLINSNNISLIIHYNGTTSIQRILKYFILKRSIPQLNFQIGNIPGTVEFDSHGNQALSWPAHNSFKFSNLEINNNEKNEIRLYLETVKSRLDISKNNQSLKKIIDYKEIKNKTILFLVGSGEYGSGIWPRFYPESFMHSPFYKNDLEVLPELLEIASRNNWYILFKPHPDNPTHKIKPHPKLIYINDNNINIIDCIVESNLILTLVSSVSGLSLLYKKPVVLLGRNGLTGMKLASELKQKEELEVLIKTTLEKGFAKETYENWLSYATRIVKYYSFFDSDNHSACFNRGYETTCNFILNSSI